MKKFILIDGNAILHRAYHALPPLSKNGQLTNAVYGFFSMFLKLVGDVKPDYIAVCFDRAKPTFRKSMYVGYQAQRPKMDDGLSGQFEMVHKGLDRAKIKHFGVDGYEADDLIGTLATQATQNFEEKVKVIIVSGDRDLLQLVTPEIVMIAPVTGITQMTLFDEAKVKEKYGLNPPQIIDYKALVGDPSDNYPGVTGIGPKTASTLLQKYQDLETLYQNIGELPPQVGEKLARDAEQAALAKKLATIVKDAPVKLDFKETNVGLFDSEDLKKYFEELGFRSLVDKIPGKTPPKNDIKKEDKNNQLDLL